MILLLFGFALALFALCAAALVVYVARVAFAFALLCWRMLWLMLNMPPLHFFTVVGVLWAAWAIAGGR